VLSRLTVLLCVSVHVPAHRVCTRCRPHLRAPQSSVEVVDAQWVQAEMVKRVDAAAELLCVPADVVAAMFRGLNCKFDSQTLFV
jgi:hypothetical protein